MIVTINTDAAFRGNIHRGAYAFWIVSNLGTFCRSGILKQTVKTPCMAEMMCIINAIDSVCKLGWNDIHKIVINTDSMNSKHIILKNHDCIEKYKIKYLKPYGDKFWSIINKNNLKGIQIDVRHVKSHVSTDTPRQFINHWCDQQARKNLYELSLKLKDEKK